MFSRRKYWIKTQKPKVILGFLFLLVVCLVSLPGVSSAHLMQTKNSDFVIVNSSPVIVGTSSLNLSLETQATSGTLQIDVLRATNTRSQLFSFPDNTENARTISSYELDLTQIPRTQNRLEVSIAVNNEESEGLRVPSTGVYPLRVSINDSRQYSFVTYVPSVTDEGMAFAARLNVAPLIKYEPFVDRLNLFTLDNELTDAGLSVQENILDAQASFELINNKGIPSTFLLSPEAIELGNIIERVSTEEIGELIPTAGTVQYLADTYAPTNFAELTSDRHLSGFDDLITVGNEVLDANGHNPKVKNTLVTKGFQPFNTQTLLRKGINRIIVDRDTFPVNAMPNYRPLEFEEDDETLVVAPSDNSVIDAMPNNYSSAARANFLVAALSVVALEAPSVERGYIVPFDLAKMNPDTIDKFYEALRNNPLIAPITIDNYFEKFSPDTSLSRRLNRLSFPEPTENPYSASTLATIGSASDAAMSMFEEDSTMYINSRWFYLAALSDSSREQQKVINTKTSNALIENALNFIALPQSRTLTLTSRESNLPVTLRNTSGSPINIVVEITSNRLSFPNGNKIETTLNEENTTIQIPVVARTSGVFPITISLLTPNGDFEIVRESATVRSTAYSNVGLGIAVFSLLFLAIWWVSHHKKSKKKPVAKVLPLKVEK